MSLFQRKKEKRLIRIVDKLVNILFNLLGRERNIATKLSVTSLLFNHIKIKGIIMEFTLSQDVQSLKLRVKGTNFENTVLDGAPFTELQVSGNDDTLFTVSIPDASDPTVFLIQRITTSDASGTLSAKAKNANGDDISGTATVTIKGDVVVPPPDPTLATGLTFEIVTDVPPTA